MSKYDELKKLAEAANAIVGDVDFHFTIARAGGCDQAEVDAVAAFLGKTNPHAILELITENERLRDAMAGLLEWVAPIAGDNQDDEASQRELDSVRAAEAAMQEASK